MSRSYIVTTGDISDFDGFLSFPLYRKAAAKMGNCDVVFIMNYPAYMNDIVPATGGSRGGKTKRSGKTKKGGDGDSDFSEIVQKIQKIQNSSDSSDITDDDKTFLKQYKRNDPGLGYSYTSEELFKVQPLNHDAEKYKSMYSNINMKDLMKMLAYDMCMQVWEACTQCGPEVGFYFVDGGVNEVNPFSINTVKNEFNVYCGCLLGLQVLNPSILTVDEFCTLASDKNIYIDMNGSMAFYNDSFGYKLLDTGRIKLVCIMGGVLAGVKMDTMSTMSFLNRFGTATMNQLYSKTKTGDFLKKVHEKSIPCYVVSNNEINSKFTYQTPTPPDRTQSLDLYRTKMQGMGLLPKEGSTLNLFNAFYTAKNNNIVNGPGFIVPLPFKPFDVLSAYALVQAIETKLINNAKLYYLPTYGSTIITNKENSDKENLLSPIIMKQASLPDTMPPEILYGIADELDKMNRIETSKYIVGDIINCSYKDQSTITIEKLITTYINPTITGGGAKIKIFGRLRTVKIVKRVKYVTFNGELVKLSELQKLERKRINSR